VGHIKINPTYMQIDQPELIINQLQAPGFTPLKEEVTVITPDKLIEKTQKNLQMLEQLTGFNLQ